MNVSSVDLCGDAGGDYNYIAQERSVRTTQQHHLAQGIAQMIGDKVAAGEYASESEIVCDRLRALQARDRALETWLRTEVAMAYDEATADPSALVDSNDVRSKLAALRKRTKKRS